MVFLNEFNEKVNFEKKSAENKGMKNYSACNGLIIPLQQPSYSKQESHVYTSSKLEQSDLTLFVFSSLGNFR